MAGETERLEIGAVVGDSCLIVFRSFFRLLLAGLVTLGPGGVLLGIAAMNGGLDPASPGFRSSSLVFLGYLVLLLGGVWFNAAVILEAHHRRLGLPLSRGEWLGESVRRAPRLLVVLLGAGLLYTAATLVLGLVSRGLGLAGSPLLLFLAILAWFALLAFLVCLWFPVFPVSVLERRGFSSFSRSAELTSGQRFRIFAVILLTGLVSMGLYMVSVFSFALVAGLLGAGLRVGGGAKDPGAVSAGLVIVGVAFFLVVITALTALNVVLPTVTYESLRRILEGEDPKMLEEVFA